MSALGGTTSHPMDLKGRVSFPAKHSRELHDDLVLVRSPNSEYPSLSVYSSERYDKWVDAYFESRGGFNPRSAKDNAISDQLYANRESVVVDQAGRILIPAHLRKYASLEKTVVMIGVRDHVKIWDPEIYAKYQGAYESIDLLDLE